jgi:serine/threonine protein phosphatase PrpC
MPRKTRRIRRRMKGGERTVGSAAHPGYGYGKPAKDQDRHRILHVGEYTILSVFDGHGPSGHIVSDFVNTHLPDLVQSKLTPGLEAPAIQTILTESFASCAKEVRTSPGATTSGTTAVVAVITPRNIVVANLGDSPALLFGKDGTLIAHSNDHDYDNPSERARVLAAKGRWIQDSAGVYRLNGALMVSRAFGDLNEEPGKIDVPELYTWPNPPSAYLAVLSDSFGEEIEGSRINPVNGPKEMVREIHGALSKELFDVARGSGRAVTERVEKLGPGAFPGGEYFGDNTTLIIANTTDTPPSASPPPSSSITPLTSTSSSTTPLTSTSSSTTSTSSSTPPPPTSTSSSITPLTSTSSSTTSTSSSTPPPPTSTSSSTPPSSTKSTCANISTSYNHGEVITVTCSGGTRRSRKTQKKRTNRKSRRRLRN